MALSMEAKRRPVLVLWLGFGGLLLSILLAAGGTLLVLDRVRADETHIRQAFLKRLNALEQIRGYIYLSGTYVRDFLLSPDPSAAKTEISRLSMLERETQDAISAYGHSLEAEEKEPFLALQTEIREYWTVLDRTISWTPEERVRLRYSFFYNELVPRRTAMLQIADRIAEVNEQGLNRAEERLAESSNALRRTLLATFGVTLAAGFVLAFLTIGYAMRLEREIEARLEETAAARASLQELSARLVRAQEDERRTLSRELHDEIGQSLSAILMEADNAEFAESPAELKAHLASVRAIAEKTVNQVRNLALLLRPSMLDDFGLVPALRWHARETAKRTGLSVFVSADETADDLPDEHKTCVFRVVQEAVNNAVKHARSRNVEVSLTRTAKSVGFAIRDDGAGFETRLTRGIGLMGMEERVRRLGGRFQLDSQLGRGTTVSAELPVLELAENKNGAYSHTTG
jgi:signal transduction histidine kinase